jgi:NADH-quinone oxidoreductase subunit E
MARNVSQKSKTANIIQLLVAVEDRYKYLPIKVLKELSLKEKIPLSRIYSIATFYGAFSLTPRGKHVCTVCMGTACHVRGAQAVLSRLEEKLKVKSGSTTDDKQYTLETVNCLGACALAPIVVIDGNYHGQVTVNRVDKLIDRVDKDEK